MHIDDEQKLIKACMRNDRTAQKALYDRFAPFMMAIAIRYVGDDDTAQDVVQEHTKTLAEMIIAEIRKNEKVTREQIAEKAGVSKKTVEREIKKMGNVHYVGRGYSGHWTIEE